MNSIPQWRSKFHRFSWAKSARSVQQQFRVLTLKASAVVTSITSTEPRTIVEIPYSGGPSEGRTVPRIGWINSGSPARHLQVSGPQAVLDTLRIV